MKTATMVRVEPYTTPHGVLKTPVIRIEDGVFGKVITPNGLTLLERYAFDLIGCCYRGEIESFQWDISPSLEDGDDPRWVAVRLLLHSEKGTLKYYTVSGRSLNCIPTGRIESSLVLQCSESVPDIPVAFVTAAAAHHGASIAALSRLNRELRFVGGVR